MKTHRPGPLAAALALLAFLASSPAGSAEAPFEIAGSYTTVLEAGTTASLALEEDGSAQYIVRWLEGDDTNILGKLSVRGRWTRQANTLTLAFPAQGGTGTIVYEVSSCLSYVAPRSDSCSPGLHVVSSDLPANRTWDLWKRELLKL